MAKQLNKELVDALYALSNLAEESDRVKKLVTEIGEQPSRRIHARCVNLTRKQTDMLYRHANSERPVLSAEDDAAYAEIARCIKARDYIGARGLEFRRRQRELQS